MAANHLPSGQIPWLDELLPPSIPWLDAADGFDQRSDMADL